MRRPFVRLRIRTRDGYKWYTRLLKEKQTGARGAVWLRRCAGKVRNELIEGRNGMRPGLEAILNQFGSRLELYDAMRNGINSDRDLETATTVAEAQAALTPVPILMRRWPGNLCKDGSRW